MPEGIGGRSRQASWGRLAPFVPLESKRSEGKHRPCHNEQPVDRPAVGAERPSERHSEQSHPKRLLCARAQQEADSHGNKGQKQGRLVPSVQAGRESRQHPTSKVRRIISYRWNSRRYLAAGYFSRESDSGRFRFPGKTKAAIRRIWSIVIPAAQRQRSAARLFRVRWSLLFGMLVTSSGPPEDSSGAQALSRRRGVANGGSCTP